MRVELKLTGLDGVLKALEALPAEVVSKNGGVARRALRKGAVLILKQAQANLRVSTSNATEDGKRYSTGLLLKNLVVTRGKAPSSGKGERQLVRVRRVAYDGSKLGKKDRAGKRVTTLQTANLLEYGSSKQQAEPWLRPAFEAKATDAIAVVERELIREVELAVRKLSRSKGLR